MRPLPWPTILTCCRAARATARWTACSRLRRRRPASIPGPHRARRWRQSLPAVTATWWIRSARPTSKARGSPRIRAAWATSVWLERANHNAFNTILPGDMAVQRDRPDCEPLLDGEAQHAWLVDYATDFLAALFAEDPPPSPGHGTPGHRRDNSRAGCALRSAGPCGVPGASRRPPDRDDSGRPSELQTSRLGGAVTADQVATHFCPKAFFSALSLPGSEPCRRNYVTVPGQPAHAVVSWETPGAALRFALPEGAGDLSAFTTLSLRATVDPASPLNPAGQSQAFSVQITDRAGTSAAVQTRPDEPALGFPPGIMQDSSATESGFFTGRVPLTTIRLPPERLCRRRPERHRRDRAALRSDAKRRAVCERHRMGSAVAVHHNDDNS